MDGKSGSIVYNGIGKEVLKSILLILKGEHVCNGRNCPWMCSYNIV